MMMASAPALLLPAAAGPASRAPPARPLPARAHLLLAARTPQRPVSVRCAHKTGGNNFAGAPGPCGVVHGPALDAVKRAAVDAFRPLSDNLGHLLSLKNVVDVTDYNVGMPLGVAMACIGCYQLFKTDPWTCLDVVLGYAFYKLSVVSSQVHRRGFCNDSITMIKTGKYSALFSYESKLLEVIKER
ncbi:hypothetical protein PR202_gb22193 [Eleusine coracana subsp. coracana]|uniref:Uncharacterized protein n=1 Tax=Eleusine coracana subsp. coracana TaxID=191504 RepID=A0AAV5FF39_ELECO|nr:hypothetical protein PR202_gb22193 [Eleusine coracana subsp. coracana]